MRSRLFRSKDFGTALLFLAIASFFLWNGANLAQGTLRQMGPGFLPRMLCYGTLLISALLFLRAVATGGSGEDDLYGGASEVRFSLRPVLFVVLAIVTFGFSLEPLGLVIATAVTVVIAAIASPDSRPIEIALIALFLCFFSVAVFVLGLGLDLPVWPGT